MSEPLIEVRDLAIGWSGDEVLLEHASFDVHRGEIFAILGRSASGKSTLLRVLVGLEPPLVGDVRLFGATPQFVPAPPRYSVLFQDGALFGSMSVGDNVALPIRTWTDLPREAIRAIARAKLRLVGLEDSYDRSPSTLSGGMRKRAALARALALESPLLLLDEPSSGLDPITSAEIDALIVSLAGVLGLTIVLVTHSLGSIHAIADRCILLDRTSKSILATGTPSELEAHSHPLVRAFFQSTVEAP